MPQNLGSWTRKRCKDKKRQDTSTKKKTKTDTKNASKDLNTNAKTKTNTDTNAKTTCESATRYCNNDSREKKKGQIKTQHKHKDNYKHK